MIPCPRCSRENPPTARACAGCGTPLSFGEEPAPSPLDAELDLDRRGRGSASPIASEPLRVVPEPGWVATAVPDGTIAVERDPAPPEDEVAAGRPAPPARRVAAWAIDGALVAAAAVLVPAAIPGALDGGLGTPLLLSEAFVAVLAFVYATAAHALAGATLGKRVARIRVIDGEGLPPSPATSAARTAWAILSVAIAGAGLIPALVSPSRRALHDLLAGTRVVEGP